MTSIKRIGKFINIFFENDFVITVHLRMTGNLVICEKEKCKKSSVSFINYKNLDILKFERVKLHFEKIDLTFCDIRKFGRIWLCQKNNFKKETGIYKLGIDPFSNEWNFNNFEKIFFVADKNAYLPQKRRKGIIKNFLLNQYKISGIGNIYADEILFKSKIKPKRKIETLTKKEIEMLFENIKIILEKAIKNRGTSFSDYRDGQGKKGNNQNYLFVYGRGNQECLVCSKKLKKDKIAGRGTVWCERCQK